MKKRILIIIGILIVAIGIVGGFKIKEFLSSNLKYCKEYVAGKGNIKGDVNIEYFKNKSEDFDIGANKCGYAVFKNPDKAFERLKEDYSQGIALIQKEHNFDDLSQSNYESYGNAGWQVNTGTEEERNEARFVTSFMDIYENSFKKSVDCW